MSIQMCMRTDECNGNILNGAVMSMNSVDGEIIDLLSDCIVRKLNQGCLVND